MNARDFKLAGISMESLKDGRMNNKFNKFLKNFSYVMLGNCISILISILVTFFVPHYFSKEVYAYFQLENLYCGYIWLVSLGWNDGLYLKYGGLSRTKLDKNEISMQLRLQTGYLMIIGLVLAVMMTLFSADSNKQIVSYFAIISVTLEILTISITNILQATGSLKDYAKITILDRSYYFIFVILLIMLKQNSFFILIGVDILSKLITLSISLYMGRDFVFSRISIPLKIVIKETKTLVSMGINISLASYASRLINGIVQFYVVQFWGVVTFGKIALTLSISNMFTKFVNAISIVLFPTLRQTNEKNLTQIYSLMGTLLTTLLLGGFVFYLPAVTILSYWLPQYQDSLRYIAILLPISLYETKVAMLLNTYFKTIHKERQILICNIITVILSGIISAINLFVFKSLDFAVFSIVILLAFRCILEEYILSKYIAICFNVIPETVMTAVFILTSWYIGGGVGVVLYSTSYLIYLFWERRNLSQTFKFIKVLANRKQ